MQYSGLSNFGNDYESVTGPRHLSFILNQFLVTIDVIYEIPNLVVVCEDVSVLVC